MQLPDKLKQKFCVAFCLTMASLKRVSTAQDEDTYKVLIKLHIEDPYRSTNHWMIPDLDLVVQHHVEFLCGVAKTGCTINEKIFTKCLKDVFACGPQMCTDFAKKLAQALSHCRWKMKPGRMSTGKKTDPFVMRVIKAFNISAGSAESLGDSISGSVESQGDPPRTPPKTKPQSAADALVLLQDAFGTQDYNPTVRVDTPSPISLCSVQSSPATVLVCASSSSTGPEPLPIQQVLGLFVLKICAMWKIHFCEHMTHSNMRQVASCCAKLNSTVTQHMLFAYVHMHLHCSPRCLQLYATSTGQSKKQFDALMACRRGRSLWPTRALALQNALGRMAPYSNLRWPT